MTHHNPSHHLPADPKDGDAHVNDADKTGPLSGIVVADFSRVLAGPYCTMLLADLGATVIKVEAPAGDDTRLWIPPARDNVSTYYLAVNRNKNSIVLDLKDPDDLATAYDIIDRADVFIENFKPGGLKQFGLDPESVAERWPDVVHTSITGFGLDGGKDLPGYDLLVQAISGFMHVTGQQDGPPQRAGVAIFDIVTGLNAAIGVLAGLIAKQRFGLGQHVLLDLLTSTQSALANQTEGYVACGNEPMRMGNEHPSLYPYGPFQSQDRELIICCGNNGQFNRLTEKLGIAWVSDDPRFNTVKARNDNRDVLGPILEEALAAKPAEEWQEIFTSVKIPCAPILTVGEGIEYADSIGLNPVVQAGTGDGAVPVIRNPITFSRSVVNYHKAPPSLGADSQSVRSWLSRTAPKENGGLGAKEKSHAHSS